jgi:hypothetical protein
VQNQTLLQANELQQSFEMQWRMLGLSLDVVELDQAPDPVAALAAASGRLRAMQRLVVQTASVETSYEAIRAYSIEASLYDVASGQRVWRAATRLPDFWRSSGKDLAVKLGCQNAADAYVSDLTDKLRADGPI